MSVFKDRREKLMNNIGDAILILPSSQLQVRNRDCNYPFRQDSDFLYLSNFLEPNSIIVLDGKTKISMLFCQPFDPLHAIWEGNIIGQERAVSEYLFDESYPIADFEKKLSDYFYHHQTVITPFSRYQCFDQLISDKIKKVKDTRRAKSPQQLHHTDQYIHPMRLIKDDYEIALMQYSADISVKAHAKVMGFTHPNTNEAEVAALLDYDFASAQGYAAYQHIVAGGNNACVLHYTDNNDVLKSGDLVLIDAGCEYNGYASDITRTFPVSGQFTPAQKKVYTWVLKSMHAAFSAAKPGNSIRDPHFVAENVLIEGMIDLGLLSGTIEQIKLEKSHHRYFMHGTSHWLGIDVHDVGEYKNDNDDWMTLAPGMVITVEPGLYIREDDKDAPEEFRGIGIRIEDDLLITNDGYLNLTEKLPTSIDEIEALCAVKS